MLCCVHLIIFVSKTFCGYARPPGWTNNHTLEADDDANQRSIFACILIHYW